MDVIIGREAGAAAPRLCVKYGDKSFFLGTPGSVPKSVSRSHCRLQINGDNMTISNVSDSNSVLVNGLEYKTKSISKTDLIELGPDRFPLDLSGVLALFAKGPGRQSPGEDVKTYHIAHLKIIWDNYSNGKVNTQVQERRINNASGAVGIVSTIGLICTVVPIPALAQIRIIALTITIILGGVFFYIRSKRVNLPVEQKRIDERFQDEYVCPHCKSYLGNQSYKLILRNGSCPRCKSKFVE